MNHFVRTLLLPAAITVMCCLLLPAAPCRSQTDSFTGDFEEGNLRGWEAAGTAFRYQPTLDDNPTARQRQQPSNHQGRYWIGTYEHYQGGQRQKPGNIQGDEAVGTLTSAAFTIPRGALEFLVGGGNSYATRVELLIRYPLEGMIRIYHATGRNSETMRRVRWDLAPHAGKTGRIRIVDNASGPWGHINADDFRFIAEEPPPLPATVRVPDLTGLTVEQSAEELERSRLRAGRVARRPSDSQPGTVIGQDPAPEAEVRPGSRVALIVAGEERFTGGDQPGDEPPPLDDGQAENGDSRWKRLAPWLWFIPGLLAAWALFRLATRLKRGGRPTPAATIRMRAVRDCGMQTVNPDKPRLSGPEIRLRQVSDRGRQDIAVTGSRPD